MNRHGSRRIRKNDNRNNNNIRDLTVTHRKISIDKIIECVKDDSYGAIVLFLGTVRNESQAGAVTGMYYESYIKMAKEQIMMIEKRIKEKWPANIAIVHRIGNLQVGDISVAVCASSAHRREAFEACRYAIDEVKNIVPIWKKEKLADYRSIWVRGQKAGK